MFRWSQVSFGTCWSFLAHKTALLAYTSGSRKSRVVVVFFRVVVQGVEYEQTTYSSSRVSVEDVQQQQSVYSSSRDCRVVEYIEYQQKPTTLQESSSRRHLFWHVRVWLLTRLADLRSAIVSRSLLIDSRSLLIDSRSLLSSNTECYFAHLS